MFKKYIKTILPNNIVFHIGKILIKVKGYWYRKDLNKLAEIHSCDKWGTHYYTPHYQNHFRKFRRSENKILEIGVGGNTLATNGGASIRMWKDYFRNSSIYAIDIYDKSPQEENRIKIFKGSQDDAVFLKELINDIGDVDIIIDDGSHINEHMIKSFQILFPLMKSGGIYVMEDLQTSYWDFFGGSSENLNKPDTAMNLLKAAVDGLNHKEFIFPGYEPTYLDKNIISVHFYHNLCFVYKGPNNEPSNYLVRNEIP